MKKSITMTALALAVSFGAVSCKKTVSDQELQTKATTTIMANPNATVEIKDGVAHLSGTYANEANRDAAIASLKSIEGVKDVMDMTTVAPAVQVNTVDAATLQKVQDAVKDFPSVKADVINGEVTITGDVSQTQARKIKESVDALQVGKVNYNYVVK